MENSEGCGDLPTRIIKEFDRLIPLHYNEQDRLIGYLLVKDRRAQDIKAPLMSISIAVVNNKVRKFNNIIEVTEVASEIKKHLKGIEGSKYLVNRREDKTALKQGLAVSVPGAVKGRMKGPAHNDPDTLPIGQILLKAKLLNEQQLTEALFEHWSSRQLLGQTLVKMGLIAQEDLAPFLLKYQEK